jgi:hypothetical protein
MRSSAAADALIVVSVRSRPNLREGERVVIPLDMAMQLGLFEIPEECLASLLLVGRHQALHRRRT